MPTPWVCHAAAAFRSTARASGLARPPLQPPLTPRLPRLCRRHPPPGFCLYSHERLRAARLSSVPVIKGVPELTPLLRPGGGSATAIAIGLSSGLRITEKASADALGRRPSGPAAGGAAL